LGGVRGELLLKLLWGADKSLASGFANETYSAWNYRTLRH